MPFWCKIQVLTIRFHLVKRFFIGSSLFVLDKGAVFILLEGDPKLLLRVHHNRAVPGDRFPDRLSGHEEEPDRFGLCRNRYFLPIGKQDEIPVGRKRIPLDVEIVPPLDFVGKRVLFSAEMAAAADHVSKDGVPRPGLVGELRPRRHRHVEVFGIGDDVPDRSLSPSDLAADDPDRGAVCGADLRDLAAFHVTVAGVHHLVGGGKIGPELEAPHAARLIPFRHLLMDDPAAGRHPLDVTGADHPLVSHTVSVFDPSVQDVRDRLDPPVGVPGEALQVIPRIVRTEIVEKQKRIELRPLVETEQPLQPDPRPFEDGFAFDDLSDFSGVSHGDCNLF